jgi:hypothetical protein
MLLTLATGAVACRPAFDVKVTAQTSVAASPLPLGVLPLNFADFASLDLSNTQDFKNQGISKDEIQSVKLKSAILTVTAPAGGTFDFVNSLEFDVSAQGQSQQRLAQLSPVPRSSTTVTLTVDGVELAPYVSAPSMAVTTNASGSPPSQDTTVQADLVFKVVPKIP